MGFLDYLKRKKLNRSADVYPEDRADILRHYQILADCEELVYSSTNFETVLRRFDGLLDELGYIGAYEKMNGVEYVEKCGVRLNGRYSSISDLWQATFDKRVSILCGAVDRCLDAEINDALKLKTPAGQERRILAFIDKVQSLDGVPVEVLKYVGNIAVPDVLHEKVVMVTCRVCSAQFRARPHSCRDYMVLCPKCGQRLRVDTSRINNSIRG